MLIGSFAPSLVHFRGPLIAAIAARGHKILAVAPGIGDETAAQLRTLGAEARELPVSNASLSPGQLLASLRALRALLRAERPDLIISYTIKPVILGALAGRAERVKRIVSMITGAGYAFTEGREFKRLVSRVMASALYRLALSRSDLVIFQNPDDERLFRRLRLLPRDPAVLRVNGSGIDLARFTPAPLPQKPAFLMIARLLKDKGIREFASAAKRLKAARPDVPIALVGYLDPSPDSLTRAELDELIGCGIDFKGRFDDVRPAIADCSVYVLPSYREGTPRSVLEAMAMGRAIITTDAPGCRETVVDGDNGILVPPRDADALLGAMLRLVEHPALIPAMGAASRRLVEGRFDVHTVNSAIIEHAGL